MANLAFRAVFLAEFANPDRAALDHVGDLTARGLYALHRPAPPGRLVVERMAAAAADLRHTAASLRELEPDDDGADRALVAAAGGFADRMDALAGQVDFAVRGEP